MLKTSHMPLAKRQRTKAAIPPRVCAFQQLPMSAYLYEEKTPGAVGPKGWDLAFPHVLKGNAGNGQPDAAFYEEWESSPFADTYLTKLAENAVDQLELGRRATTDFLGISYS